MKAPGLARQALIGPNMMTSLYVFPPRGLDALDKAPRPAKRSPGSSEQGARAGIRRRRGGDVELRNAATLAVASQ